MFNVRIKKREWFVYFQAIEELMLVFFVQKVQLDFRFYHLLFQGKHFYTFKKYIYANLVILATR